MPRSITWRQTAPLLLSAFMLLGARSAFPHALVVRSNPSANVTVQNAPREVAIFFSERIQPTGGTILTKMRTACGSMRTTITSMQMVASFVSLSSLCPRALTM